MSNSPTNLDHFTEQHLQLLKPVRVLDVGAGACKHGLMVRKLLPNTQVDAVEPTQAYSERFNQRDVYNTVYNMTIQDWAEQNSTARYDVVIMSHCLEHMYRSQALDIVDCLLYRTQWLIAVWPTNQSGDTDFVNRFGEQAHNPYEMHKSNLTLLDFTAFDIHFYTKGFIHFAHTTSNMYPVPEPGKPWPKTNKVENHYAVLHGHCAGYIDSLHRDWA